MRLSIVTAVACLIATGLSAGEHAQAAIKRFTNIPAQALEPALEALAKDRDIQLLYRSELVTEHQTAGATGDLTLEQALTEVLKNTGLTFKYLDEKAITIVPAASTPSGEPIASASADDLKVLRLAQSDSAGKPGSSENQDAQTSSSASTEELEKLMLEEIVVTAQKRLEKAQDVPISIGVLSGDALDRSTDKGVADALNRVPGVMSAIPNNNARSNLVGAIVVRGVAPVTGSGTTAYYLDSIPFGFIRRSTAPDSNAYDLERIEVLRGPQGTLYGASSMGGVVRILTKDANPDRFEGKVAAGYSATSGTGGDNYRGDKAVNPSTIPVC